MNDRQVQASRGRRAVHALALIVGSGGMALWRAVREVQSVGRDASIDCKAGALMVPGYRLRDGEVGRRFQRRLQRAWRLCRHDPRPLMLSGFAEDENLPSEAHAALDWMMDMGLPDDLPLVLDTGARSTLENLLAARRWIHAMPEPLRLGVVSNRYHLARIARLAERLDLPVCLCAAEHRWRGSLRVWLAVLREALALMTLDTPPANTRPAIPSPTP